MTFDPSVSTFDSHGSSDEAYRWAMGIGDAKFVVKRRLDGSVLVQLKGAAHVVSPMHAVEMAKALLKEAGVDVVFADRGQTVIRPPSGPNGHVIR